MKAKKRTYIIIGAIVIVLAIILIIFLSARARSSQATAFQTVPLSRGELIAIVGATGSVHANQSTILTWKTSGRIETINVQVDDTVAVNTVLAKLDSNSLSQSVILAEADLVTAKRALEELKNSEVAQANAFQNMVKAQEAVDDARDDLESKNYDRASQETLDIARANLVIAEDAVTKAEEAYDRVDSLGEDDPIRAEVFSQLAKAKQKRDNALANLNWLLGLPDEQELATVNAALDVALANLDDATREWERLKNGPDPDDIKAAEARVAALEATINQIQIVAPFNGTITDIQSKLGDEVTPGSVAFRIDDLSRMLVDVEIPEVDINRVQVNQSATITFDAIQTKQYEGKVVEVARVGNSGEGVVNFTVQVELINPDDQVLPGMTAAVNIIVNQMNDVLLIPNRAVRLLEGERVVYVLRDNLPVVVPIKIGASSDTYSELAEGEIAENELIILNPPTDISRGMMFGP